MAPSSLSPTSSSSSSSLLSPTSSPTSSSSMEMEPHFLSLPPRRKPRVSAEHTLNRVRENQRRHRARRKDYIATLEEKLADTERQLAEARAEIEVLRRERETAVGVVRPVFCDHEDGDGGGGVMGEARKDSLMEDDSDGDGDIGGFEDGRDEEMTVISPQTPPDLTPFLTADEILTIDNLPSRIPIETLSTGPPPCCEDVPSSTTTPPSLSSSPSSPSPECSSCHERPAPLPTESTTLCAQAYAMIQQQNFRGIDASTIRLWLYQGYRRARREGEGCRVENGTLFRLLDYISGI
ncbi:hypothetical protein CC80DRAFT_596288 [Byssothecium circinans]|uniref:BZIP domain-containing protein n=1 Tax=Byssothecium circinans TaxID=147558 RepID=A0A6A5TJ44_9PLEO|nr:hypothetical protein CC80DRAFT_596288 [Byssothecium circinans]